MTSATDRVVPADTISALASGNRFRVWPLRLSTLLSGLTLAVLSPLLLFGAYSLSVQTAAERAAERENLRMLALNLADAVDRELAGQIVTAQILAAARVLKRGDHLDFWRLAEDAASQAGGQFILIDRDHQQLLNTYIDVGMPLPRTSNPELADAVMNTGEPLVSNLITVAAAGDEKLYTVRVRVVVDGVARYALSYVPRAGAMLDVVQQSYRPDGWKAVIVDGSGLVIARSHQHEEYYGQPSPPSIWQQDLGQSGITSGFDLQGVASLTAYHATELSDWRVFVWTHESVLQAPARAARRQLLLWASLAVAAAILSGWLAGRMIQRPTRHLVAAAKDMAAGREVRSRSYVMQEANNICEEIVSASGTIRARETALRDSEEHMRVVIRVLSHRTLNLLTVIQLVAKHSGRIAQDHTEFMESFVARIAGLARSHDLLITTQWSPVSLKDLVTAQLLPFAPMSTGQVEVDGAMIMLRSEVVQNFGMAIHELATNSLKYGALSVPEGRLFVNWTVDTNAEGEKWLHFRWRETAGPAVKATERLGFGSIVTEKLVPGGVGGEARTHLRKDGLVWELDVPLANITD